MSNDDIRTLSEELSTEIPVVDPIPAAQNINTIPTVQIPDFLKAETGPGGIEEYIEHPLNFSSSKGLARMIRGLTGILGSLNLAIIDIVIGGLEFMKEKKASAPGV